MNCMHSRIDMAVYLWTQRKRVDVVVVDVDVIDCTIWLYRIEWWKCAQIHELNLWCKCPDGRQCSIEMFIVRTLTNTAQLDAHTHMHTLPQQIHESCCIWNIRAYFMLGMCTEIARDNSQRTRKKMKIKRERERVVQMANDHQKSQNDKKEYQIRFNPLDFSMPPNITREKEGSGSERLEENNHTKHRTSRAFQNCDEQKRYSNGRLVTSCASSQLKFPMSSDGFVAAN